MGTNYAKIKILGTKLKFYVLFLTMKMKNKKKSFIFKFLKKTIQFLSTKN
jgi:hypothetical protein